jgi:hypothetical protein
MKSSVETKILTESRKARSAERRILVDIKISLHPLSAYVGDSTSRQQASQVLRNGIIANWEFRNSHSLG